MQWFAFVLLISFSACFAQQSASTGKKAANHTDISASKKVPTINDTTVTETNNFNKSVNPDNPVINGGTVTDIPVTEINGPTLPPTTSTTTQASTSSTSHTTTVTPSKPSSTISTTTAKTPTSSKSTTTTTSTTTVPVSTTAPPHHDRKFDGPSFVGGIILALGLVAIGFVAFKFYKARTEMNYHTL